MISHLIHDSEESLHSDRALSLLYKDTAGQMDCLDVTKANMLELIKGFHDNETRLVLNEDHTVVSEVIKDPGNVFYFHASVKMLVCWDPLAFQCLSKSDIFLMVCI